MGVSPRRTVSVIVPTRNRPELLVRALRSITGQRYEGHVEAVVVFDQSPPHPIELDIPEDRSLRVIVNGRSPGLAGARNAGCAEASGTLLAFCDDDDEWLPDKLARQVELLEAEPTAEVASCGVFVHYGDRITARVSRHRTLSLRQLLRSRNVEFHPSTFLVGREAFLHGIGPVDEAIPGSYAEDYDWLLRAARRAPIVTVQAPLVRVHWHASSYFEGRWRTIAEALRYLVARHPEFAAEPKGLARIYGQIAFAEAAAGETTTARTTARRALSLNPCERRAILALAVSTGLLRPDTVLRAAHAEGRGI